jgi:hypothetical protein
MNAGLPALLPVGDDADRAFGGLDPAESTVPSHITRRVDHPNE